MCARRSVGDRRGQPRRNIRAATKVVSPAVFGGRAVARALGLVRSRRFLAGAFDPKRISLVLACLPVCPFATRSVTTGRIRLRSLVGLAMELHGDFRSYNMGSMSQTAQCGRHPCWRSARGGCALCALMLAGQISVFRVASVSRPSEAKPAVFKGSGSLLRVSWMRRCGVLAFCMFPSLRAAVCANMCLRRLAWGDAVVDVLRRLRGR